MAKKPVSGDFNGKVEYERRFIVHLDQNKMPKEAQVEHIEQAYFLATERKKEFRLRISDGKSSFSVKNGKGIVRSCQNVPLGPTGSVRTIMGQLGRPLEKIRKRIGRWKIDFFEGKWRGLVIAEYSLKDINDRIVFPDWMQVECEITGIITNYDLFKIAGSELNFDELKSRISQKHMPWIVLTGGPCSGKSSILDILKTRFQDTAVFFPEIATLIIKEIGLRPEKCATPAQCDQFQESIYYTQSSFEASVSAQAAMHADPKKAMIIDRGTVDCLAYIEGGDKRFEELFCTTIAQEYAKYALVICLGMPDKKTYNKNFAGNTARYENYQEALEREQKIVQAWNNHPRFRFITACDNFSEKAEKVITEIDKFLSRIK